VLGQDHRGAEEGDGNTWPPSGRGQGLGGQAVTCSIQVTGGCSVPGDTELVQVFVERQRGEVRGVLLLVLVVGVLRDRVDHGDQYHDHDQGGKSPCQQVALRLPALPLGAPRALCLPRVHHSPLPGYTGPLTCRTTPKRLRLLRHAAPCPDNDVPIHRAGSYPGRAPTYSAWHLPVRVERKAVKGGRARPSPVRQRSFRA